MMTHSSRSGCHRSSHLLLSLTADLNRLDCLPPIFDQLDEGDLALKVNREVLPLFRQLLVRMISADSSNLRRLLNTQACAWDCGSCRRKTDTNSVRLSIHF